MKVLKSTMSRILDVDVEIREAVKARQDSLTKPVGSLGRLEDLSVTIAGILRNVNPAIERGVVFVMAADHGLCAEGISAFPQEVTAQMVFNFLRKGAAINALATAFGARVVVADIGVACDFPAETPIYHKKIARGTNNFARTRAMTRDEAIASVEAGIDVFETELMKEEFDIAATGDMGIGNTSASCAVASVLMGMEPSLLAGRGTGIDDETLKKKVSLIEHAIRMHAPTPHDPLDVLSSLGGFEIGALAGVILASAAHRVPILIDGYISGAAALVANALEPKSRQYMIAGHVSADRGHLAMLEYLGLEPLLNLGMRLGEGTGAALAMGLCRASCRVLNEMATFESAGVRKE
jgi:nicotinate-nucleotide--dimethylbenzimidazole phosphoribosyltransferase